LTFVAEPLPQAIPFMPNMNMPFLMVPLPGNSYQQWPTILDRHDPLGLEGTQFLLTDKNNRKTIYCFFRKNFCDVVNAFSPEENGTYVLVKNTDPIPSGTLPIDWDTTVTAADLGTLTLRTNLSNGTPRYYGVCVLNQAVTTTTVNGQTTTTPTLDNDFGGAAAPYTWFVLYKTAGTNPMPSSSSSSGQSASFLNPPTTFLKGQGGSITFLPGTDLPVGGDVVFQTWSNAASLIQGAVEVASAPFIYPVAQLNTISDGSASVQALIRDANSGVVKTIAINVMFSSPSSSSSSNTTSSSSSSSPTKPSSSSSSNPSSSSSSSSQATTINPLFLYPMYIETQQLLSQLNAVQTAVAALQQSVSTLDTTAKTTTAFTAVVNLVDALPATMDAIQAQVNALGLSVAITDAQSMLTTFTSLLPQVPGMVGFYYPKTDFSGTPVIRIDPTLNMIYTAPPIAGIPQIFAARWYGVIKAPVTGAVNIILTTDDGVRMYFNGSKVFDAWTTHGPIAQNVTVQMTAGQSYPLMIEYENTGGNGQMTMQWSYTGQAATVVPSTALSTR
jgi:hypothetical protein